MNLRFNRARAQREKILAGLQELSNAVEAGRNCWVTFDANSMEHWVQCTTTVMRIDWPFSTPPRQNDFLRERFGGGQPLEVHSWQSDSFATFTPAIADVDGLVATIDDTFRELYGLGDDYVVSFKVEDGVKAE